MKTSKVSMYFRCATKTEEWIFNERRQKKTVKLKLILWFRFKYTVNMAGIDRKRRLRSDKYAENITKRGLVNADKEEVSEEKVCFQQTYYYIYGCHYCNLSRVG